MKIKTRKNKKAFTLMELTVALIISGLLASLAIPRLLIQVKNIRNQEGVRILLALYEQQLDYMQENPGANYGANIAADLYIDIPAPENFDPPAIYANKFIDTKRVLAGIKEDGNDYTLYVTEDGKIICDPVTIGDKICQNMGY